jgi:hypothetical protein
MKTIFASRSPVESGLLGKVPPKITGELIDESCHIKLSDGGYIIYKIIDNDILDICRILCETTKPTEKSRSNGLSQRSSVFGFLPRVPMRHDFCRATRHTLDEKKNFRICAVLNEYVYDTFQQLEKEKAEYAMDFIKQNVCNDYIFCNSPFTTVNVNMNHAIKYHYDKGNFSAIPSTVLIYKKGVSGGELCLPEINITLSQRSGALTIFDGRSILHGAMPIQSDGDVGSIRGSLVFYTMKGMGQCLSKNQELARAKDITNIRNKNKYNKENLLKIIKINKRALGDEKYLELLNAVEIKNKKM